MKIAKGYTKAFIITMAGTICFVLALTVCIASLMKIPMDTSFFTFVGNILMAFVVQNAGKVVDDEVKDNDKDKEKEKDKVIKPVE